MIYKEILKESDALGLGSNWIWQIEVDLIVTVGSPRCEMCCTSGSPQPAGRPGAWRLGRSRAGCLVVAGHGEGAQRRP
jgi:hypothetical protein